MVRCSLSEASPGRGVNVRFTVCWNVNESNMYRNTHILIQKCLGKVVEVLRAFLADEVNHERSHRNMHDVQCVVKMVAFVLKDTDGRGRVFSSATAVLKRGPRQAGVHEVTEGLREGSWDILCIQEVNHIHVVWIVGKKRVPQPHGIAVLLVRWSAGEENSKRLTREEFWTLCPDVLLDVGTQIHPQ